MTKQTVNAIAKAFDQTATHMDRRKPPGKGLDE
jgi:hypothetical protein